ncbi:hypothetical protein [Nonomuraea rubra]|uniref:hypothetical protein n=1 Tax=Nonomuraea rubra TaxID=46180 RepID=UPI0033CE837F
MACVGERPAVALARLDDLGLPFEVVHVLFEGVEAVVQATNECGDLPEFGGLIPTRLRAVTVRGAKNFRGLRRGQVGQLIEAASGSRLCTVLLTTS